MKVYIQSNKFQNIAAKVAKYSFVKNGYDDVEIIDLETNETLKKYFGKKYNRKGKKVIFSTNDLQSFTLLRFFPTKLNFYNKCLVIDPDVFLIKKSLGELENLSNDSSVCCTKINNKFRTEVMVLNKNKYLWNFDKLIESLFNFELDYEDLIHLNFDNNLKIYEIPHKYNQHDTIKNDTVLLHTTNRITQPWKEGLKINFRKERNFKDFIKNFIKKTLGMHHDKYFEKKFIKHNNLQVLETIESFFFHAIKEKFISEKEMNDGVKLEYISKIFLDNLSKKYNLVI
tara:strand:+ start:1318 stop:2172 length:855 start_codon:yes stop_codon:yes gene_type:complete